MTSPPLKLGPIGQISRSVKDIRQAEAWYGQVLGLPHLYTYGTLAFFDCGGVRLFVVTGPKNGRRVGPGSGPAPAAWGKPPISTNATTRIA